MTAAAAAPPPPQAPALPALPAWLDVACPTGGCVQVGQVRRVALRQVALGVVDMPTPVCRHCGAHMCRVQDRVHEGDDMAKITRHGGPSNAVVNPPVPGSPDTRVDPADGTRPLPTARESAEQPAEQPAEQEGDTPSPGSSSSTSSKRPATPGGPSKPPRPKRARTAASPSKPARKAASTAVSTATSGPATAGPNSADGTADGAADGGGSG
jgi:hypothetical protein